MLRVNKILFLYLAIIGSTSAITGPIATLREKLLRGYDKNIRPVVDHNNVTTVHFGFSLNYQNLDDETQTMHINTWLILSWYDEFLKWDSEKFDNIKQIHLSPQDIWTPDIALYNSNDVEHITQMTNVPLIVTEEGKIIWFPPYVGEVPCQMALDNWPSDDHTCKFYFGSWTHHGELIDIQMWDENGTDGVILSNYEQNTKWNIANLSSSREIVYYEREEYVVITFEISVKRMLAKYSSYFINSGFAIMLVIMMSYGLPLQFQLTRILFHAFGLSLFVISLVSFFLLLPPLGGNVPVIMNYYTAVIILTSFSLLITIILCNEWILYPIFYSKVSKRMATRVDTVVVSVPLLRKFIRTEVPYEDLEPEFRANEIDETRVTARDMNHSAVFVLRLLNFVLGFTFAISFMVIHVKMKATILRAN